MKKGEKMSKEQKLKISKSHKSLGEKHWSKRAEVRKKMSESHKGQVAWNKGKPAPWAKGPPKGGIPWNKGKPYLKNEKHGRWKGDEVGYDGLHRWIGRKKGKPVICEHCGKTFLNGRAIHWANKSQLYKRDLNDWMRLCVACHKKYDS